MNAYLEPGLAQRTLTHKQQAVFEFIQRFIGEYRYAPLIREIQLGCEIASYKSAIDRLNALERKGYIKRAPNKHRGIRVTHRPASEPQLLQPTASDGVAG